jgi:hypothetical protein
MKRILMFVLLLAALKVAGQTTGYFRYDTVRIMKQNGTCELYIINKTKDSLGLLTNVGGGLTRFIKPKMLNDSTIIIGLDTLSIKGTGGGGNLQNVTDRGNKTTDTVIAAGVRTPVMLPDTTNENDFELAVFPDVQGMTSGFPTQLSSMFDWVINHKTSNNIQGLLTLGDLTDHANTTEYNTIDGQFDRIDSLGSIPYLPIVGNHDYDGGEVSVPRPTTNFNTYFGASRFAAKSWEGNSFHGKTENHYIKFDVGSTKFLVLGMEFIPTDSALNWASSVIDSFPDRKVIITTHAYVTYFGERSTDTSYYGTQTYGLNSADNSGQEMWDNMIRKKKNVIMVLNGHFVNTSNENRGYSRRITDVADSGNIVHQIFVNYQRDGNGTYSNPTGSNNVGMGYFLRLRFSPKSGKVYASYYSSYLDQYDSRIDSFNVYLPGVKIQNSPAILGGLYVKKEARFDDTVTVKSIGKYSIATVGDDNKLVGDTGFIYKNKKVGIGLNTPATPLQVKGITTIDTLAGGATAFGTVRITSTTNPSKGRILFGNSAYDESVDWLGIGTNFPSDNLHILNSTSGNVAIRMQNTNTGTGAGSRLLFFNETATRSGQVIFCNSTSAFSPNGLIINSGTNAGKLSLASISDDITFGKSTTINGSNEHARFKNNGNLLVGATTDNAYKIQIYGSGYVRDSLKIDNMPNGASNDSDVIVRNNVLYKISQPKLYNALLSQSGTSDPTTSILGSNSIGSIAWTRTGLGSYTGTLSGAFTASKTFILVGQNADGITANCFRSDNNTVTLKTYTTFNGGSTDVFSDLSIEIRVYP